MPFFKRKPTRASSAGSSPTPTPPAVKSPPGSGGPEEARILAIGSDLLNRARGQRHGVLSAKFYGDKLMEWSMKDQAFKVQMFRFVDAFPTLRHADDIYEHLRDYLDQPGVQAPSVLGAGLKLGGIAKGLAASTISKQITGMAGKFIAGTDARSALPQLKKLWDDGIAFSVDLLGEACVSEAEADAYRDKYLDLIENLPGDVSGWTPNPRLETDHLGAIPRVNVSIKVSSLSSRVDPIDTEGSIRGLMARLEPIIHAAKKRGVFINFDMEQNSLRDLTLTLFERCNEAFDFASGIAMQAYLRSGPDDARRIAAWAKRSGKVVTVRLVKGAYWDSEVINAQQQGWPCPVWPNKPRTDACFEEMAGTFLDACPRRAGEGGVKLALGSHNARSIAAALAGAEARGLPPNAVELQMLHGMADPLKLAAAEMGLRIREYVPVGEMIPGMAYLVRRLLENTSNESWLKAGFMDQADAATLLASPADRARAIGEPPAPAEDLKHALSPAVEGVGNNRPFFNEPMRDFSVRVIREAFGRAVAGATVPKVANDRTAAQAREMVTNAVRAYPAWRDAEPRSRARVLTLAAEAMRQQRDGLAGVMVKEAGKTWREADADVCEAIDFCDYYARLAVQLFERRRLGAFVGELDETWYQPRGVAAVIAPWNFPLAICCGMTVAALVTGNPTIIKPAEQTPGIAKLLYGILDDALSEVDSGGDVLQYCPGVGEVVGAALVEDPRVALIAFTGSKAVGLGIVRAAGNTLPEQAHVKKVVCEMGGKNAIIIDTSADQDEAVLGVRHSAFGFQGQKCSACSRVIVVDPEGPEGPAIRRFTSRLVEATRALVVGDPQNPGTDVGPVIDAEARAKIMSMIDVARRENRLELALDIPAGLESSSGRCYVAPHIFSAVRPEHLIAREEIFGPVLAVMHARDFDEALEIANGSAYKLTGGVFSRKPSNLSRAKREFRVGNLYVNRGITGALVGRQPFGGFGMSGVGSKAGGVDYLLQFVEPRASCENMMRRGFSPEL